MKLILFNKIQRYQSLIVSGQSVYCSLILFNLSAVWKLRIKAFTKAV